MSSAARPQGTLYVDVARGRTVFFGTAVATSPHTHYTASITVALGGSLRVRAVGQADWNSGALLLAAPSAAHELDARQLLVLNFHMDPEGPDYARLRPLVAPRSKEHKLRLLSATRVREVLQRLRALVAAPSIDCDELWSTVLSALAEDAPRPHTFDARVTEVLAFLQAQFPIAPSTAVIAKHVGLSEGRLIRLFGSEVGVPLRRYVLWMRLRYVLMCLFAGHSLTSAAHEAGFADSAHLTRTYREMFGVAPSSIFRSRLVEVRFVGTAPEAHQR